MDNYKDFSEDERIFYLREAGFDSREKELFRLRVYEEKTLAEIPMLQGQMVDGIDTVKAKDVDMSGNPVYYPKTDGTEVYRKQLQADGRSRIFTYRLVNEGEQPESNNTNQVDIVSLINQLRDDVHAEISEIKELLPIQSEPPKTQKGGNQR